MILTPEELLELVPQQSPFRFIDTIDDIQDTSVSSSYTFKSTEDFYKGHFPGSPITPGVILIEAACQMTSCIHAIWLTAKNYETKEQASEYTTLFSDIYTAEFLKRVLPGEKVIAHGKLLLWKRKRIKHEVTMKNSNGETVMTCVVGGVGVKI